jgi:hypothetical protein
MLPGALFPLTKDLACQTLSLRVGADLHLGLFYPMEWMQAAQQIAAVLRFVLKGNDSTNGPLPASCLNCPRARPESWTPDRHIPQISSVRPGVEGSPQQFAQPGARCRPISSCVHPRRCRRLIGHATRPISEGRVMMCQRCGKACANRTEGCRVRVPGEDRFFCNACWLHATARSGSGDLESICGGPGVDPQGGELAAPEGR